MTGPEHYRQAEYLAERANHYTYGDGADAAVGAALAAEAQVHATLALVAATALQVGDYEEWSKTIHRAPQLPPEPDVCPECGHDHEMLQCPTCVANGAGACAEQDEPEPEPEFDPGPEVDDEGGMSEYRYLMPEDYLRG